MKKTTLREFGKELNKCQTTIEAEKLISEFMHNPENSEQDKLKLASHIGNLANKYFKEMKNELSDL